MCQKIAEGRQKGGKSAAVVKLDRKAEVLSLSALLSLKKPESRGVNRQGTALFGALSLVLR